MMGRFITSTLAPLLLMFVTQGRICGAGAPQQDRDGPRGDYGERPPGNYQQTCRNINYNGSVLNANCQKRDGGWRNSSLDYRSCRGTVINDDGHLRCGGNERYGGGGYDENRPRGDDERGYGGRGDYGNLPRGDYKQTCQNMRMDGNRLVASCQKKDGGWRSTSLDNAYQCRNVYNDNGHLRCGG